MSTMMKLGHYRFALDSAAYQQLQRSISYRWQSQERVATHPALHYTGVGAQQAELEGVIYPTFKGGLHQIDAMKQEAGKGKPLQMVDGTGTVWGKWVITEIEETQQVFGKNGTPRKITFRLRLHYYGYQHAVPHTTR